MLLKDLQQWFGARISQPLTHTFPHDAQTEAIITPSATLSAHQRLELYHQQYWWRLLKSLQTNFPTLARLFGYTEFQQTLAIPYLSQFPPSHWALCQLGESFASWIEKTYHQEDRYLILNSAKIDWAAQKAFWVGNLPKVEFDTLSEHQILHSQLTLQPHIHLFSLQGDLFTFRDALLEQEPEHYATHPFPKMEFGQCHFALYRSPHNHVNWKKIPKAAFELLKHLQSPTSLHKACSLITDQQDIEKQIAGWFQEWTALDWLRIIE